MNPRISSQVREVVFGMEDGMVSTMGAITGIAVATGNPFVVLVSGFVIISVESISMGVGSYLSNKSEKDVNLKKIDEEKSELIKYPEAEKEELYVMYCQNGWSKEVARTMADEASQKPDLLLSEMTYHELKIVSDNLGKPFENAIFMGVSYVLGGGLPLLPYLLFPVPLALGISIPLTMAGIFLLGSVTTRFTGRKWWKAGFEMFVLAGIAAGVGYGVGRIADVVITRS
ncbi:MAG: VIT1/CCC1 transporter family protein [bacterium]|nr:VIT1/CCC1 transporter family protein [bacterium]